MIWSSESLRLDLFNGFQRFWLQLAFRVKIGLDLRIVRRERISCSSGSVNYLFCFYAERESRFALGSPSRALPELRPALSHFHRGVRTTAECHLP